MMKNYKDTCQNTLTASGNNIKELQKETIKNLYLGGGSYFRQYLLRWHQSKKNGQTKKQLSLYQI